MIAIIDYGAGNIRSIAKALEYVGATVEVTDEPAVVATAQAVVLPGVGSGGAAMTRITELGLDEAIRQATQQGKPFLGICLGMQLLADHHAEGEVDGLGL
ncbi:MAG: imidazole glycerol phosphate synthase subunit HisH, partial [Ktedonobacteraceae bacterium]|nr:imidazole glycerol phosphate synthase subunit HisH [Ktedonobacteraceae bacterium]